MSKQALINIISKIWKEIQTEVILKEFKLTGIYGVSDPSFMKHEAPLKQQLKTYN